MANLYLSVGGTLTLLAVVSFVVLSGNSNTCPAYNTNLGFCPGGNNGSACNCTNGQGSITCNNNGSWVVTCSNSTNHTSVYCPYVNLTVGACGPGPAGTQCECKNGRGVLQCDAVWGTWDIDNGCFPNDNGYCNASYATGYGYCAAGPPGKTCSCYNEYSGSIICANGTWYSTCEITYCNSIYTPEGSCPYGPQGSQCLCYNSRGLMTCERDGEWYIDPGCYPSPPIAPENQTCNYTYASPYGYCEAGPIGANCSCYFTEGVVACRNGTWNDTECGGNSDHCSYLNNNYANCRAGPPGTTCICDNHLGYAECMNGVWDIDAVCFDPIMASCNTTFATEEGYCSPGHHGKFCTCNNQRGNITCENGYWEVDIDCYPNGGGGTGGIAGGGSTGGHIMVDPICNAWYIEDVAYCSAGPPGKRCECFNGHGEVTCLVSGGWEIDVECYFNGPPVQQNWCNVSYDTEAGYCAPSPSGSSCPCNNGGGWINCNNGTWEIGSYCNISSSDHNFWCSDAHLMVGNCTAGPWGTSCPCDNGLGSITCTAPGTWKVNKTCNQILSDDQGASISSSDNSATVGAAAGATVGALVLIALVVVCLFRGRLKKYWKFGKKKEGETMIGSSTAASEGLSTDGRNSHSSGSTGGTPYISHEDAVGVNTTSPAAAIPAETNTTAGVEV